MPRCTACRTTVFATNDAICPDCGDIFCPDHIDPDDHACGQPKERGDNHPDPSVSDADLKQPEPEPDETPKEQAQSQTAEASGTNMQRLAAGAIIAIVGVAFTLTTIGALVGIPMMILGFGVIFPRFTAAMAILAGVAFIGLLFAL